MRISMTMTWLGGALAAAFAAGGCGGGSAGATGSVHPGDGGGTTVDGPIQETSGPYEPLAVGASWKFHVNDKGVIYDKTSTVETQEDAGGPKAGTMAFRLRDSFPNNEQLTWYVVAGDVVQRIHEMAMDTTGATKSEDWYDPFRLRVDGTAEHTAPGATFTNSYVDHHTSRSKPATDAMHNDGWKVDGVDEPVGVPAGNFKSLHVTHTDSSDGSTKQYWFVKGIGKVREETSSGHVEELTDHQHP
jgi:hypothetical protein